MNDPSPLEAIFFAALEKGSPDECAAYLDEACAGHPDFRLRVGKMLAAQAKAGSFLEQPALTPVATIDEPVTERPGTLIGPYKLLEQIGEGGFGVVFLAEQTQPVRRKVALKVLKPGMGSRSVVARFEAERQALALMDHPNIARVFDGGATPSSRPYFVMELVKGVPITEFCDQNHQAPRQRLELFVQVCHAVQHAHQKGVIHRDLKPSNVLVSRHDTTPVVKVIDFGVSKALGQELTDKTLFTGVAQMVGTPLYMSPEQAGMSDLDVDTRSDIYSLGVLLYELLAGTTPFDKERFKKAGYDEIRRIIREEEPARPSTKLSTLGQDAATVSANRGSDPRALSRLFRGELDWIVMKALEKDRNRRYETANGFATDVQRYLADEAVLACPPSMAYRLRKFARRNKGGLAVAAIVLFFLVLLGSGIAWAWRDRTARAADRAHHLERAVEKAEFLQREGKRGEALAALERAQLLARETEPSPVLTERIESLRQQLDAEGRDEAFVGRFEAIRRDVESEVDVENSVFLGTEGYPKIREALEQYGIAPRVTPPATAATYIQKRPAAIQAVVLTALDECLQIAPKDELDACPWFIEVLQKADTDPWRNQVRQAWKETAKLEALARDIDVREQPPSFLVILVRALRSQSPSSLVLAQRVQFAYPDDFWANQELAQDLDRAGKHAEAIRYLTAALALRRDNAGVLLNRASSLYDAGEVEAAIADLRRAIAVAPRYVMAHFNLGYIWHRQNKLSRAIDCYRKVLELNPKHAGAYTNLGIALRQHHRPDEALAVFRKAIEARPDAAHRFFQLIGDTLHDQKRLDEAIDAYRKAIALKPEVARPHRDLGVALRERQELVEAIDCYRKAIALDPKDALAYHHLGLALRDQKKLDEAIDCYKKAIALDPKNPAAHINLGIALAGQGKLDEAIACYRKAIDLDPKNAAAHSNLGAVLRAKKKLDEAVAAHHKAVDLDPKNATFHSNLGNALRDQKKWYEAVAAHRKAVDLDPKNATFRDNWALCLSTLAWTLATHVEPTRRDPGRALSLAREAVELAPQSELVWQFLGWVQYRVGDWQASIEALEKSCKGGTGDAGQWIVLALAHARLAAQEGLPEKEREQHTREARRWFEKADKQIDSWWRARPGDEVGQGIWDFRAEARELLGAKQDKK